MTREHKLALILGFAIVLVAGVLLSDHLSSARTAQLVSDDSLRPGPGPELPMARGESRTGFLIQDENGLFKPVEDVEPTPLEPIDVIASTNESSGPLERIPEPLREGFARLKNAPVLTSTETAPILRMGEPPARTPDKPATALVRRHTVQEGDTLWGVSELYYGSGSHHANLAAHNRSLLGPGGALVVGSILEVPPRSDLLSGRATPAAPGRSADNPAEKPAPRGGERTYTVKSGDALSLIAQKLLGSASRMQEIVEMNSDKLSDPDAIEVGMVLRIPGYTRRDVVVAKLSMLIACGALTAAGLLAVRQQRIQAVHEMTRALHRATELERDLWRARSEIAAATTPGAIRRAAEKLGPLRGIPVDWCLVPEDLSRPRAEAGLERSWGGGA